MLRLELAIVELALKSPFRHAAKVRHATRNLWVRATLESNGERFTGYGEGLPRDYVTGENEANAVAAFHQLGADVAQHGPAALNSGWDATPAMRAALEIALADLAARLEDQSLQARLPAGPPPRGTAFHRGALRYSAVLSADEPQRFKRQCWLFRLAGFRAAKVKVGLGRDQDRERVRLARRILGRRVRLRVDANCAWSVDDAVQSMKDLAQFNVEAVEEPVARSDLAGAAQVARSCGVPVILDESFTCAEDLRKAGAAGVPAIANLRISKLGGLDRTLECARVARELGFGLILGCQVGESGLLSAAERAIAYASLGDLQHAEGSYDRHLLAELPTTPDITFGLGGKGPAITSAGLGVTPTSAIISRVFANEAGGRVAQVEGELELDALRRGWRS